MQFGYFDDQHREYVITRPDTPLPWINYLGNRDYFSLISNTAGGYSFFRDARLRRLTRYRYNNVPLDTGGRCLYIRDNVSPGGDFWSPAWQPVRRSLEEYECRHGLGYTRIRSRLRDIEADLLFFVPLEADLEIWQMTLTNHRTVPVDLSVTSCVEFNLWDAWDDATNFQRNYSTGEVEVEEGVIYHKTEYRERRSHFSYFACSQEIEGFETSREAFLGPYRGWDSPLAVETGRMTGSIAHGWQPVGAHQVRLVLDPGEQKTVSFFLGYHDNPADEKFDPPGSQVLNKMYVLPVIHSYRKAGAVQEAFNRLCEYWDELLGGMRVWTPDEHTNRMVNTWNQYQVIATFNLSRSASYFESGIGRGMGFRDSNQDLLAYVQLDPLRARQRLLDLAATQLPDGGAYHQYQPLTRKGNHLIGSDFYDDPLWLVLAASAYIKETADWDILQEPVPLDNMPGTEESLYVHLRRAVQYTLDRLGPHGLPLIGRADWNDCLNLNCFSAVPGESFQTTDNQNGRVAESVFIAGLFLMAVEELEAAARYMDNAEGIQRAVQSAAEMEKAVWKAGWDGEWFRRAYDGLGDPVGSADNEEGRIYIEPQGICVMAGLGVEDGRARRALDSVRDHLATPHGIVLHQPAYTRYYLNLGEISSYPPGYKENAGIFCHTNPWIMIAEAMIGRGDQAFDYYQRINPSARETISDVHRCEPYVYAQMIAGCDAPTHGEAKNSWLTGTAAWNFLAISQWILGVRPTYEGLLLAPVIPESWSGFRMERFFRGALYDIEVNRIGPGSSVVVIVDGEKLEGNVVPPVDQPGHGKRVKVLVNLGAREEHR